MDALETILGRSPDPAKRVVLPEATEPRVLRAAVRLATERIVTPILIGDRDEIADVAGRSGADVNGIAIVEPADPELRPVAIEAIREAHEGGSPMSSHIARKVVNLFQKNFKGGDEPDVPLTDREKEILTGLSDGESYNSVAESLFISVDTVRYHIRNIYQKLQVHSQSAAVSQAIRKGLI